MDYIEAKFNKPVLGNTLGGRTQMELVLASTSPIETKLSVTIYPINPVGQKLQFCGRKSVPQKVMTWRVIKNRFRVKEQKQGISWA